MKHDKGFIALVVIILIVLGITGAVFFTMSDKEDSAQESMTISAGDDFPKDYKPADHTPPSTNVAQGTNQEPASLISDTSNWKTYKNTQYGYELTLTDSWKDNQIVENFDGSVDFKIKVANGGYWRLYTIMPMKIEEWNKKVDGCSHLSPEEQDSPACHFINWKIAENDKYVFIAMSAQDFPQEQELAHTEFWQKIVPTFKFTK